VLTLSPQYATFGTQTYNPGANGTDLEQCTMDVSDLDGQCTMSQVGRFIHLINIELPFFWCDILLLQHSFRGRLFRIPAAGNRLLQSHQ